MDSSLSGAAIRQKFLDYFQQQQHTFIPSSSTIPHDDPTLLFANAGMNQVTLKHMNTFIDCTHCHQEIFKAT